MDHARNRLGTDPGAASSTPVRWKAHQFSRSGGMMNSSSFTDQARAVLELARVNASTRHHERVDPEHLLLGLMGERDGAGAAVLRQIGIDPRDVQARVEGKLKPSGSGRLTGPDLPYTARAKRVLGFAMRESRELN